MRSRCVLIAGFGSVGRRHLRNLRRLGWERIVLLRSYRSTLPDDEIAGLPVETSLALALEKYEPLGVVVANPTAYHLDIAVPAAEAGCHLFIEKPLSHSLERVELLRETARRRGVSVLMGYQFRFHPGLRTLKRIVVEGGIGRVVNAQVHWGEYLPAWHPWEDYRRSYSGRMSLGGGAILTLCHPFDYLRWLLGEALAVSAIVGRCGALEIDVEDSAEVSVRFESGAIGHVHLDYIRRPARHYLSVIGQDGSIDWSGEDGSVRWFRATTDRIETLAPSDGFERNAMFMDEMRHFLACLEGEEVPVCNLDDGVQALRWALGAKTSAQEGRVVSLAC